MWVVVGQEPTPQQLAQLSKDQDWSDRWGSMVVPEDADDVEADTVLDDALNAVGDNDTSIVRFYDWIILQ